MPRILDVIPVSVPASRELLGPIRRRQAPAGFETEIVLVEQGPTRVETLFEAALAAPAVCDLLIGPAAGGFDGVVVDCMLDPGVREAREVVGVPVLGPNEAAVRSLEGRFSRAVMLTIDTGVVQGHLPVTLARGYPGGDRVVGFAPVPTMAPALRKQRAETREVIREAALRGVRDFDADVVVIGCTLMSLYVDELRSALPVPVIDPMEEASRLVAKQIGSGPSSGGDASDLLGRAARFAEQLASVRMSAVR